MVKFCSTFENCNFLKTQIALQLCNLGDKLRMGKEDPDLPDLCPLRFQAPDLRVYNWKRNTMEEDKYYRFITDDCQPNCIALCINHTC